MKRILYLFLILTVVLGVSTCKRAKVDDPTTTGPSGFRIILAGTASPSTLYLPIDFSTDITSLINVVALNSDGTPAVNQTIIFQVGDYGYFEGMKWTDTRTTNGSGRAQIEFVLEEGCCQYAGDTQVEIKAILQDDGRLDHQGAQVYEIIPLRIVPEGRKEVILISGYVRDGVTRQGIGGVPIVFTSTSGGLGSGLVFTANSGHYHLWVPWYWTGTVSTGPFPDYTFTPSQYTFTDPLIVDQLGVNFIGKYGLSPTLDSDTTSISAVITGTTVSGVITVNVFNSSTTDVITCNVAAGATWITISNIIPGLDTPFSFDVTIDDWTGTTSTAPRTADITITATSPAGVTGSPFTITVTQSNI